MAEPGRRRPLPRGIRVRLELAAAGLVLVVIAIAFGVRTGDDSGSPPARSTATVSAPAAPS